MECLFCGSNKIKKAAFPRETFFNDKKFGYVECIQCHLVFINPLPSTDDYRVMYSPQYHENFYFQDTEYVPSYLDEVLSVPTGNKKFLDYGCGDGSVLRYVERLGLPCYGTEYDSQLIGKLKKQFPSFKIYQIDDFWQLNEEVYNYIHLGDVLEHIEKPFEFLKKLKTKLEPSHGRLIIRGPLENNNTLTLKTRKLISSAIKKFKPNQASDHVPYHISFSSAKNQLALFERAGIDTVSYQVSETHWPYPNSFKDNLQTNVKYAIAAFSILLSKTFPSRNWGNRFVYIGKVNSISQ